MRRENQRKRNPRPNTILRTFTIYRDPQLLTAVKAAVNPSSEKL